MAKPQKHRNKWRVRPVDEHGKRRSFVFDNYKDALSFLRQHEAKTENIRVGLELPRIERKTFAELAVYYLEFHSKEKRNYRNDESIIRRHLIPHFKDYYLDQVGRDIDIFRHSKAHLNVSAISSPLFFPSPSQVILRPT